MTDALSMIEANNVAVTSTEPSTSTGLMPALEIYNFEHGFSSPRDVRFGPYMLRVCNDAHTTNEVFKTSGGHTFEPKLGEDATLTHVVTPLAAKPGIWAVTANVDDDPTLHAASILFPDMPFMTGADDLSLVLWLLTGREVAIGANKQARMPLCAADRLVSSNYFFMPVINWSALPTLPSIGVSDAVYAICLALATPELLLRTSLGAGALDVLASKWHKSAKLNRYDDNVRARCKTATDAFRQSLADQGVRPAIIDDVAARIPGLMSDSAFAKLQAFLIHLGMLTADADEATIGRVKLLNKHRNAIAHTAGVLINPKASIEIELQIASAVSAVVLKICRVYIAKHLLGVQGDEFGVDRDEENVREFFTTGRLHGQDVFNEAYGDYLARIKANWVETGIFPA